MEDMYSASAAGRTWSTTASRCSAATLARRAISSAFCASVESPGFDGQSMLPTVATHTARNSRGTGGGAVSAEAVVAFDGVVRWPQATEGMTRTEARRATESLCSDDM